MTEKVTLAGLVRTASIMATIAKEPTNVNGAYRLR